MPSEEVGVPTPVQRELLPHEHVHEDDTGVPLHNHAEFRTRGLRALVGALGLNFIFMVVEAVAGVLTGSLALLSDAAHMLTDVLALSVAAFAALLARAAIRGRYTFGLARMPVLGGLFNGVTAMVLGVVIVIEAIERMQAPPPVDGMPVLVVATLGLGVNVASALWLHRSKERSVNTRGAMLHMLADALGSVAAILSGLMLVTTGWRPIDPLLSVLVAGIVITSALPLLRDVLSILLEGAPGHLDLDAVKAAALKITEVEEVIGLHAWELDSGETVASLVLVTREKELPTLCEAADRLRGVLEQRFSVRHATVEWRDVVHKEPCCTTPDEPALREAG